MGIVMEREGNGNKAGWVIEGGPTQERGGQFNKAFWVLADFGHDTIQTGDSERGGEGFGVGQAYVSQYGQGNGFT